MHVHIGLVWTYVHGVLNACRLRQRLLCDCGRLSVPQRLAEPEWSHDWQLRCGHLLGGLQPHHGLVHGAWHMWFAVVLCQREHVLNPWQCAIRAGLDLTATCPCVLRTAMLFDAMSVTLELLSCVQNHGSCTLPGQCVCETGWVDDPSGLMCSGFRVLIID